MKRNLFDTKVDLFISSFGLGIAVFFIYITFLSKMYNYDGVACAMAVELGEMKNLFHGNHLIYGFIGYLFHHLIRIFFGYAGTALLSLQILNCLLGSIGVVLFFILMEKISKNITYAFFWSLFLAFSYSYWLWSMEAQVYLLGMVFILLLVILLLRYDSSFHRDHKPGKSILFILALCHGMAVLSHISHIIFIPVVCVCLWQYKSNRKRNLRNIFFYLVVLAAFCVVSYLLVIIVVLKIFSLRGIYLWFLGNALDVSTNSLSWHGQLSLNNLLKIPASLQDTIWINFKKVSFIKQLFPFQIIKIAVNISKIFFYSALFYLFLGFGKIYYKHKFMINLCFVWLICYSLFFSTWEPGTIMYRMPELVPLYLLVFMSFSSLHINKKIKFFCLSGYLLSLVFSNFCGGIYPYSLNINNVNLERAFLVEENTSEEDLVLISGKGIFAIGKVYIPYFARRQTLILNRFKEKDFSLLKKIIFDKLARGNNVFFLSDISDLRNKQLLSKNYRLFFCTEDKGLDLFQIKEREKND